jgi:sec-independent protein translocase protein TatB
VARTLGHLWGRAQRYVNGVKADIERDMAAEEFRQLQQKVQAEAGALEQYVKQVALTADQHVQQINEAVAQLSSPGQAMQPGQTTQLPPPTADPSSTLPANKSQ